MKNQPNKNYNSNDDVMTPLNLCEKIINYFKPAGTILEPCKGSGNFLQYLPKDSLYCEIKENKPFENFNNNVDWIITNPPWSKVRLFLEKSCQCSNKHIVFLITVNHVFTKARIRITNNYSFYLKDILYIDTPKEFPQMGFQLGIIHWEKDYNGQVNIKYL